MESARSNWKKKEAREIESKGWCVCDIKLTNWGWECTSLSGVGNDCLRKRRALRVRGNSKDIMQESTSMIRKEFCR